MKARQAERKPQSSSRYHDYHATPRTKPAYIVDLLNALKKFDNFKSQKVVHQISIKVAFLGGNIHRHYYSFVNYCIMRIYSLMKAFFPDYIRIFRAKAQRSASVPIHHHSSSSKIQTSYIPKSEKDFAKLLEFFVDYKHHQENQQAHESKPFHNFSGASRTKSSYLKDFLSALHKYEI